MADIVSLIERFAADERLFVVFDEFQEVKKLERCDEVLALLRSKIQLLPDTCFGARRGLGAAGSDPGV